MGSAGATSFTGALTTLAALAGALAGTGSLGRGGGLGGRLGSLRRSRRLGGPRQLSGPAQPWVLQPSWRRAWRSAALALASGFSVTFGLVDCLRSSLLGHRCRLAAALAGAALAAAFGALAADGLWLCLRGLGDLRHLHDFGRGGLGSRLGGLRRLRGDGRWGGAASGLLGRRLRGGFRRVPPPSWSRYASPWAARERQPVGFLRCSWDRLLVVRVRRPVSRTTAHRSGSVWSLRLPR